MRSSALFRVVRGALAAGKERCGFGLVHFSVQSNHLHLLAEAESRTALSRGVQGICVRIARAVHRQLAVRGRVFSDRYHDRSLRSPRAVQLALRYVLLNARKHQGKHEGRSSGATPAGFVDECSSAPWFEGFARPGALVFGAHRARAEWLGMAETPSPVSPARSWLLRVGYQRAGPFDCDDTPGG